MQRDDPMERKLVTCPESAHLEEIEYESSPCGMLIASCTRFQPRSEVSCTRECAARFDRRQRLAADTDAQFDPAPLDDDDSDDEDPEAEIDLEIALFSRGTLRTR